jgi:diaminopimelate epimerase
MSVQKIPNAVDPARGDRVGDRSAPLANARPAPYIAPVQPLVTMQTSLSGRAVDRMNGAGNKILVLDARGGLALPTPEEARAIHAAPGLDYDQMMVIADPHSANTLAYVPIYNNDGSLAGACGNGTRCVADRLARETGSSAFQIETERGLIACERLSDWTYRVDMGSPRFGWREIPLEHEVENVDAVEVRLAGAPYLGPASVANMGNPHVVFFVDDVADIALETLGPRFEAHPLFPEKVNVSFAQILGADHIRLRVWERGVGVTLACGSAACATLVAAARRGLTRREARVTLPGGELVIGWRESDCHVLMTGPVEFERRITLEGAYLPASAERRSRA